MRRKIIQEYGNYKAIQNTIPIKNNPKQKVRDVLPFSHE